MSGNSLPPSKLTWIGSDRRLARRLGRPVLKFMEIEAASGIVLVVATVVALIVANSPLRDLYHEILDLHLVINFGDTHILDESVEHLVNDALMAIFFFVVGLEIKRELVAGELRDPRAAALPSIAAIGGMVVPALFFFMLNTSSPEIDGWGIPMATDIAFALGVMSLLGPRVPVQLKLFLLTLAIVDDIGAIAVIAIFYTTGVSFVWLAIAIALLALVYGLQRAKVWYTPVYAFLGTIVWYAVLESGVHATIAGVALGLLAPATPLQKSVRPDEVVGTVVDPEDLDAASARRANLYVRESVSVCDRLEKLLHPFSSFVILPIFALANAGIELSGSAISDAASSSVTLGIVVGLLFGKTIGVSLFTWIAVRSGISTLPRGVGWTHVVAVSILAGIGFTVALFITGLAYADQEILDTQARMGILLASLLASIAGVTLLARASAPDTPTESPAPLSKVNA
ncbi:MAG: Na+/H+ antiporter NhaA [Acidimicrobiales bacterium]|nr:Na+/H+ antiporter NhaA [Acidimicrobiales bacterium]RZV46915.1 MAG: Na+/H+ antiporter NhaA [Acidimicrobiales bacterium]